jgi:spore photoproduct lyase
MASNAMKIKTQEGLITGLDGKKERRILKVGDGSIITRFDKTPLPEKSTDVVCPHFLELKWGYGCPYSCSWCYLQGTYRWPQFKKHGSNIDPIVKDENKIREHLLAISENGHKELLNAGELADSLMFNWLPKFLVDIKLNGNKVLFLTKSNQVDYLIEYCKALKNKIIMSFTFNASPVAEKWERGAPKVLERIKAAKRVSEAGYKVRIRIDPMVPIQNWESHYKELVDKVFEHFIPERLTLGSLRGLQSTINRAKDKSWVHYMNERSNWGKKIDLKTRYDMYSTIINYLQRKQGYSNIALCKETLEIWDKLDLNYKKIKCNCVI